jgi:hypothetical protein
MADGDNANNGAVETFRVLDRIDTKMIAIFAIVIGYMILTDRVILLAVLCGIPLCLAWLARNVLIIVDDRGLLLQDWRKRKTSITWESVKSLLQTENAGVFVLSLGFIDEFGKPQVARLAVDTPKRGKTSKRIEELKEGILRHKHFTNSRETEDAIYGKRIIWE